MEETDLVILWGSNAREAHPIFFHHVLKAIHRGARLYAVDRDIADELAALGDPDREQPVGGRGGRALALSVGRVVADRIDHLAFDGKHFRSGEPVKRRIRAHMVDDDQFAVRQEASRLQLPSAEALIEQGLEAVEAPARKIMTRNTGPKWSLSWKNARAEARDARHSTL